MVDIVLKQGIAGWLRVAALLLAPAFIGAKGCGVVDVGDDGCGGLTGKACGVGSYCKFESDAQCGAADQTGECVAMPQGCGASYDPVCGCDDKTYSNDCVAAAAGISVLSKGACAGDPGGDQLCGGIAGLRCDSGEFCAYGLDAKCGAGDRTGSCKSVPQVCTKELSPVCGCDNKTYDNECSANAAGVSIVAKGKCDGGSPVPAPTGKDCGGLLGLACAKSEFCNFAPTAYCGAADQTGVCTALPQVCTAIYAPVCGCDDKTYASECAANAAGVSVASKGECVTTSPGSTVCGTRGAAACAATEFCNYPETAQCGQTDKPGSCAPKPELCTEEYAPVCGCDGKTYGNACAANAAGVSAASKGECGTQTGGKSCGGLIGAACEKGEFCHFASDAMCGAADQTGTCETLPVGCPKNIAQVCGCDDKTYDNECLANSAGTSVVSQGACKQQGKACGARLGDTCSKGEFCHYPDAAICGQADGTGFCETIPTACTKEYSAVCGCDGKTYSNGCMANAAGTSVSRKGTCEAKRCGYTVSSTCAKGEFCTYEASASCGQSAAGVCQQVPDVCDAISAPVCGCDNKTYSNECVANSAGIAKASDGECKKAGKTCGGLIGAQCAKGEYCDFALDAMCGAADQTGTCQVIPDACTADYTPVCGCDDKTYGNACEAHSRGVSVGSKGECADPCATTGLVAPPANCK